MGTNFVFNGIMSVIKKLNKIADCPFCGEKLRVRSNHSYIGIPNIIFKCDKCKMKLTLCERKR